MKPIKIKFTKAAIEGRAGSWFYLLTREGGVHPKSWYKPDCEYGIVNVRPFRNGRTWYDVQRLTKTGRPDLRAYPNSFLKVDFEFNEQDLGLNELL